MKTKIVVPQGMMEAFKKEVFRQIDESTAPLVDQDGFDQSSLAAALQWLVEELQKRKQPHRVPWQAGYNTAIDGIKNMFLEFEPDPLEDLLYPSFTTAINKVSGTPNTRTEGQYEQALREAYRRGQKSQEGK